MVEAIDEDSSQDDSEEQKKKVSNSEHILHRVAYEIDSIRENYSPK